jgi:hypothetical protein
MCRAVVRQYQQITPVWPVAELRALLASADRIGWLQQQISEDREALLILLVLMARVALDAEPD